LNDDTCDAKFTGVLYTVAVLVEPNKVADIELSDEAKVDRQIVDAIVGRVDERLRSVARRRQHTITIDCVVGTNIGRCRFESYKLHVFL
jgi:hypothetical protein